MRRSTRNGQPKLSAAYDKINLNPKLFDRVSAVYAARETSGLDAKQQRLVTRTYDGFVRRGAKLGADDKVKMAALNQELASAFSEFNSRLLKDEATFIQASEAEMAGVQQDVKDAAAAVAKDKGLPAGSFRHPQYALGGRAGAELRFQPRASREGVAGVRQPRRQWKRQRHQRDHRQDRQAAGRPRQTARVQVACPLADAGHDGQVARARDGADDARLAGGGRSGSTRKSPT